MNLNIGKYEIDTGRVFVIAEIGNNHNGEFSRAIQMVDLAVEMGADCAKFQMRHLDEVYRQRTLRKVGEDWRLIDVIGEGISLVSNLRSQFGEILNAGGPDRLLTVLREKNASGTPAKLPLAGEK